MCAGKRFFFAVGGLVLGAAALGFGLLRYRPDPAPAAPVFGEVLRLAPPVEEQATVATRPAMPDVPVSNDGRLLRAGRVAADLQRPLEELRRLVLEFRRVHAEFRKDRRDPARRLEVSELGLALGGLLGARPELGLDYFHAVLEEPHPDAIRDLAPILEVGKSAELRETMLQVLSGDAPQMQRYLAASHLGRCLDTPALTALVRAWSREGDTLLRHRLVASLIVNLGTRPPEDPEREQGFEVLRRAAREEADGGRRTESLGILVEAQQGQVSPADRALLREAAAAEPDAFRRGQLEVIAGKLKP